MKLLTFMSFPILLLLAAFAVTSCANKCATTTCAEAGTPEAPVVVPDDETPVAEAQVVPEAEDAEVETATADVADANDADAEEAGE